MSLRELVRAVEMIGGRAVTEASGRITADIATAVAAIGVELISVGWIRSAQLQRLLPSHVWWDEAPRMRVSCTPRRFETTDCVRLSAESAPRLAPK